MLNNFLALNTDSDDETLGIPKCPLCLENLNEVIFLLIKLKFNYLVL